MRTVFIELMSLMRQWTLRNDFFDFPSSLIRAQERTTEGKNYFVVVRELCSQERDRNILVEQNVHTVAARSN